MRFLCASPRTQSCFVFIRPFFPPLTALFIARVSSGRIQIRKSEGRNPKGRIAAKDRREHKECQGNRTSPFSLSFCGSDLTAAVMRVAIQVIAATMATTDKKNMTRISQSGAFLAVMR